MEFSRFTSGMTADAARLAQAAEGHMDVTVPSCPEWTMSDLVLHLAVVYRHKIECIQRGEAPKPWPPAPDSQTPPLTQLRTAMGDLLAEFTARGPGASAFTWFGPDQTVGFWIRRMAQETLIHRVDAEQAAGVALGPIDEDLALDGIDELLSVFVAWGSREWAGELGPILTELDPSPVAIRAGERTWIVTPGPNGIDVAQDSGTEVAATISGSPTEVLLWGWRRGDYDSVAIEGNADIAHRLYDTLSEFTQ